MQQPQYYYQLGGWRGHIASLSRENPYSDDLLAESIAGPRSPLRPRDPNAPLELILGIKRTGASYLLLTKHQARLHAQAMTSPFPRHRPFVLDDFESLSPVYFHTVDELRSKLSSMRPKKTGRDVDTSQANRDYTQGSDEGIKRGIFEHNRVFYRILQGTLDLGMYNVPRDTGWIQELRICAFTFNTWRVDQRSVSDRRRSPHVLDMGFAEATVPGLGLMAGSAVDIFAMKNSMQTQGPGTSRQEFEHGKTERLDEEQTATRIREVLRLDTQRPLILLVMDKEVTLNILHGLGVHLEIKSINSLIYGEENQRSNTHWSERQHSRRSRSRSPHRPYQPSTTDPRRRNDHTVSSVISSNQQQSVYLVDVKDLYLTMMREAELIVRPFFISELSPRLGMPFDKLKWCAGNEAVLLIELWKAIISGSSIDQQKEERLETAARVKNVLVLRTYDDLDGQDQSRQESQEPSDGEEHDDDDDDPNNWQAPQSAQSKEKAPVMASIDPDDLSDYGDEEEE